jgi:hypothetical protein
LADRREGKAPSTQAGEFVREEIHHIREGKHGARSTKQAIAIGLSKARRSGVPLEPPARGKKRTKQQAAGEVRKGRTQRGLHDGPVAAGAQESRLLAALVSEPHVVTRQVPSAVFRARAR